MSLELPIYPGKALPEEVLAVMANPANNILEETITVTNAAAVKIAPMANRQQIILQIQTDANVWIRWDGSDAVVNSGMVLAGGAMFGLSILASREISIIAEGADVQVYILQLGERLT